MLHCSKVTGAEKIPISGFFGDPQIIIQYIPLRAETYTYSKDIYRDSGAGSVGAIARGRQRGQGPASAIRPGGEIKIKEKKR